MSALAERPAIGHQRGTRGLRRTLIAAVYPLAAGVAQFNGAMARAMASNGPVDVISWRRLYPPRALPGASCSTLVAARRGPDAAFILDWHDPRSWRRAVVGCEEFEAEAVVLPWLHPVMTPPYSYVLRHVPKATTRVLICHNVEPHESVPGGRRLSRAALRHADLLVTHAPHQRHELGRSAWARSEGSMRSTHASTRKTSRQHRQRKSRPANEHARATRTSSY